MYIPLYMRHIHLLRHLTGCTNGSSVREVKRGWEASQKGVKEAKREVYGAKRPP